MKCLAVLDELIRNPNVPGVRYLRALVREKVNDLIGSLSDIEVETLTPNRALTKARLQAKLGFNEDAVCTLRALLQSVDKSHYSYWASLAVGIIGRRFDLELLGFKSKQNNTMPKLNGWMKGCAIEHLIALGEFAACKRLFSGSSNIEFSLLAIYDDIGNADELRSISANNALSASVRSAIRGIRGWLSIDEATVLAALAARIPKERSIVEIGSFQGRSTSALATGSKMGFSSSVHTVDTHTGLQGIEQESTLPVFQANLRFKRLEKNVTVHLGTSAEIAHNWKGKNIGLLFIDGDHNYESVKNDFESWLPHLAARGLIAFHDSPQPGPNRLLREIIHHGSSTLYPMGLRDSLTVLGLSSQDPIATIHSRMDVWYKYLTILGKNHYAWMNLEKTRLDHLTLGLFDQTGHALTIGNTFSGLDITPWSELLHK